MKTLVRCIPKKGKQFRIVQLQAYGRDNCALEVCPGKFSTTIKITENGFSTKIKLSLKQQARLSRKTSPAKRWRMEKQT